MAAGKPVVASDIPGYRDLLDDGKQGLLAERKNERALAEAIVRILKDPALHHKMGKEGRIKARQYSWPEVASRVLDYYQELLAQRKGAA
jgi:phosphatidylinositol alpha-mannosyltransferase